ncbi:MAG: enoyl-CoA hydratase/isomerase family protein [Bacteroidia bacterium]|nr:enoyl-CoA hydratase/isomerase family protein [Bacteroidia bacterium]
MNNYLRPSTLEALGLGSVLDIIKNGKLPIDTERLVNQVFGEKENRGALVITGANGIVGAGKVMQFASRLAPYNVPIIALDLPCSADGFNQQTQQLLNSFGREAANDILKNVIRLNYDGNSLPPVVKSYNPTFLLEAIPENLELKKAHYALFKKEFPDIHIFSVTSGFPSAQLGVSIAHPAFPHEINKIFEVVEPSVTPQTQLLWSLGLIPVQVSDDWSFVLDVFFCGLLQASIQFANITNTPYWKIDKYIRRLIGPNPFRAHDVIGAKGSNFLTWSCLYHLGQHYGNLFTPVQELTERKDSGQNWYPPDHFRPLVNWNLADDESVILKDIILGALFQMTSIMIHEKRADFATMNAIGELCAQFTKGMIATARKTGSEQVFKTIQAYHQLIPQAAETAWYPDVFKNMDTPEWQQLYVNAEHDGSVGVITLSRESYSWDVDAELNRAIDWLKQHQIKRVVLTGDFHLSTQMVGADITEFFPAVTDPKQGAHIAYSWSETARRLHHEFEISIGFINGKRCMGGMLELMMHCHYLFAVQDATLAMPEVTLPVIPGMEGCHWAIRKAKPEMRKNLLKMLIEGKSFKAKDTIGWLTDFADTAENSLQKIWQILQEGENALPKRLLINTPLGKLNFEEANITPSQDAGLLEARKAITACIENSCNASIAESIHVQAKLSGDFMVNPLCRKGRIGAEYDKMMQA